MQPTENGTELKWCIFSKGIRGSVGKIIVDLHGPLSAIVKVVFVRKEFRGFGLGTVLMQHAQQALLANGFERLELEAEEDVGNYGKLVGLYEHCGFFVTPGMKETYEYNGDQTFRKVHMTCNLHALRQPDENAVLGFEFAHAMHVEAVELSRTHPLRLTFMEALRAVDTVSPGSLSQALRSARYVRERGHPDWMELAAGLRFLGQVQYLFNDWRAPYAVAVRATTPDVAGRDDDGERMQGAPKSGPLPAWANPAVTSVVAPDRFPAGVGLDEVLVTWSEAELAYVLVNHAGSAPHEMAQLLRYHRMRDWIETGVCVFASDDEAHLLDLVRLFATALHAADVVGASDAINDDAQAEIERLGYLVDKYFGLDVHVV